ncbi:MAG: hypothetical protein K8R64_03040 [Methanosarcinaceae archaeon]|nr:hypothetical protein [Methanosarcinaceae archaeon]
MRNIKNITTVFVIVFISLAYIGIAFADTSPEPDTIDIQIAPATLNLNLEGPMVTVHADIAYSKVDTNTLELNGVPASDTYSDDRGNLVARFDPTLIRETVDQPEGTLTFTGKMLVGTSFTGEETVRVIEPPAKNRK